MDGTLKVMEADRHGFRGKQSTKKHWFRHRPLRRFSSQIMYVLTTGWVHLAYSICTKVT